MTKEEALKILNYYEYGLERELKAVILEALEKQIPKKPKKKKWGGSICPQCEFEVVLNLTEGGGCDYAVNFCPQCGQCIDWSKND